MEPNDKIEELQHRVNNRMPHYYGAELRIVYIAIGIIVLISSAIFVHRSPFGSYLSVPIVLITTVLAGFTSAKSKKSIVFVLGLSVILFMLFSTELIRALHASGPFDAYAFVCLLLSVLALFSVYFSSRTFHGMYFE